MVHRDGKVDGRELKQCFEANERFTTADIVRIMSQVLDALDYSHRQGVIHRDIKPANIFLLPGGTVKVADFGIAHIETSNLTQVGAVMGTPSYMSPEQIMGLPVDGRSDLFSAGVILYQFLTGERPFAGSATTTMQKVLKEDPLPPSSLNVQAPAGMDAVVRKALAKRPEDRFQTAREFADALRAAAPAVSTTSATSSSAMEPTLVSAPEATVLTAPGPTASSGMPRRQAAPVRGRAAGKKIANRRDRCRDRRRRRGGRCRRVVSSRSGRRQHRRRRRRRNRRRRKQRPRHRARPGGRNRSGRCGRSGNDADLRRRPGRSQRPALPHRQGAAANRSARRLQEPAGGKGAGPACSTRTRWRETTTCCKARLLSQSASFVPAVVQEGEPQLGKDGLMSITTQGVVNVKASAEVAQPDVARRAHRLHPRQRQPEGRAPGQRSRRRRAAMRPPQPSPVAENLLKERIKSFGFRTWSEGGAGDQGGKNADFLVQGEARVKKLSMQLPASGLTVSKYALTSWTVKCIDRETGEEIYYNTALPKGIGSWASEEEALQAIGSKIADEFSRDFLPAACQPDRAESHAQRRWHAQPRGRGTAGARADRIARRDRGDRPAAGEAARL